MTTQTRITKHVDFCAAHSIKDAGKCANKHGHNWHTIISVDQINGERDKRGFIADVQELKEAAFKYDHDDLDNYFESASTENVAQKIADDALEVCKNSNPDAVFIVHVHLDETVNNSADTSASNFVMGLNSMDSKQKSFDQMKKEALDAEAAYAYGAGNVEPKAKFVKRTKND